jgi:stage II sporulation protein E
MFFVCVVTNRQTLNKPSPIMRNIVGEGNGFMKSLTTDGVKKMPVWSRWMLLVKKKKLKITLSTLILFFAFFLSKAVLFEAAVPFFLPIWAIVARRYPRYLPFVWIGGLSGSLTLGIGQTILHVLQIGGYQGISQILKNKKFIPLQVAMVILLVQFGWQWVSYSGAIPLSVSLLVLYESILSAIMTVFLFQLFVPMHALTTAKWTFERIGAAVMVSALMLTGMGGLLFGLVSVPLVLVHLVIFGAVSVGGVFVGTAVATIMGTILSLSQLSFSGMIAVYALSGLSAGLFQNKNRLWIAIGSFGAALFFTVYDNTLPLDKVYFASLACASMIFFILPTSWINYAQNQFFPKPSSVLFKRQQWLTDKVNTQLFDFQQFVEFITQLVNDRFPTQKETASTSQTPDYSVCGTCFRQDKCWGVSGQGMYPVIEEWKETRAHTKSGVRYRLNDRIQEKCVRSNGLVDALEEEYANNKLAGHYAHGKKMLAYQLRDMSQHVSDLMADLQMNEANHESEEEKISKRLDDAKIAHFQIDMLSEEQGARKIVCCLPIKQAEWETNQMIGERLIIPILHELYDEPFEISRTSEIKDPFPHIQITFQSAVRFTYDYGVFTSSYQNTVYSGDAHSVIPLHSGLVAFVLSDGMGQNMEAYHESRKVIRLLRECLQHQMNPETAMHTLHYVMSLKHHSDLYATVDLALLDLQQGKLWSFKAGSMSTYLLRGKDCVKIDSQSVPIGFLPTMSVDAEERIVKAGDILVMLSDGMFSPDYSLEEQENELIRLMRKYESTPTGSLADLLAAEFNNKYPAAEDDRTLIVVKLRHAVPEWSLFSPSYRNISRERMIK